MRDGIYSVTFRSNRGEVGTGVVIFNGGKAYGGDAGYYYKGSVETDGEDATAHIEVTRHQQGQESIFGPLNQFTLHLSGTPSDEAFTLRGNVAEHPQFSISIEGRKVSDL